LEPHWSQKPCHAFKYLTEALFQTCLHAPSGIADASLSKTFSKFQPLKQEKLSQVWWLKPVIVAAQEMKIRKIMV
jgi:hypothetical protein